jgi:nucleoside-diphosphate-sugar epimerase
MPRYLVTGCAGFVGSTLVEALLADGCEVFGVDSFNDYYPRALKEAAIAPARSHPNFTLTACNLAESLPEEALDGVDGIFHLAGRPGVRASWGASFRAYVDDNVLGTHRVVEHAASRGIRLVLASSSSIYGDALAHPTPEETLPAPVSPYGVTKLAAEQLAAAQHKNAALDFVALRYFSLYGPRQRPDMAFSRIIAALVDETAFEVYGSGDQSRDFTYVGDAVAATVDAMRLGPSGAVYNVGAGSEATLREAITVVEELSGLVLEVRFGEPAAGDVRRTLADTTKIRAELGWEPQVTLRAGLAAMLDAAGVPDRATQPVPRAR